jgi:hypothetical protein
MATFEARPIDLNQAAMNILTPARAMTDPDRRRGNGKSIAACGGGAREAVKALIVANQFVETDLEKLRAVVSMGYCTRQAFRAGVPGPEGLV